MKLENITPEDLVAVKLPMNIKAKIFFIALPVLFLSVIVMLWEVLKELVTAPSQVIDLLTLEESLKILLGDDK